MKTDRDKHQLRGPVRSVRIEMAQLEEQDGQQVEQRSFGHSYAFDSNGRLVEYAARNPDGSTWRTVNDYSDAGTCWRRETSILQASPLAASLTPTIKKAG